jgi:flagellar motor switch protein FliG
VGLELVLPLRKKIVEQLNHVPEDDLSEVMDFLEFLAWKAQQTQVSHMKSSSTAEVLSALRGRGKGEQLVERLLAARQADRKIDEQSHDYLRS